MAKRLIDLLIFLIVVAAIGVGAYFGYTTFLADDETTDNGSPSGAAQVTGANLELPRLTQTQFLSLLIAPEDLPDPFRQTANAEPFVPESLDVTARDLATTVSADASIRFSRMVDAYNWQPDYAIEFDTCTPGQDITLIGVEVSQFDTAAAARTFIDDPEVRGFFQALGYTITPADHVHGWYLTSIVPIEPEEGGCFGPEWHTGLFFEYWGMLFLTTVKVDGDASPDIAHALSQDLAVRLIQKVDQLDVMTGINIPPTPEPAGMAFDQLITADVNAATLQFMIPSASRWGFYSSYDPDPDEAFSFTLVELIDFYRAAGTPATAQLANEIDRAGRRMGLIAREVRAFKPDPPCPADEPARIDVTVSLFERPAGAQAYMQDAGIQAAWRGTGLFNTFTTIGDAVYAYGTVDHACGAMQTVQKTVSFERVMYTIALTLPATTPQDDAVALVDALAYLAVFNAYIHGM